MALSPILSIISAVMMVMMAKQMTGTNIANMFIIIDDQDDDLATLPGTLIMVMAIIFKLTICKMFT